MEDILQSILAYFFLDTVYIKNNTWLLRNSVIQ